MTGRKRANTVHLQLSDEEKAMLCRLAERDGLSLADVLRMCIRRAFAGTTA